MLNGHWKSMKAVIVTGASGLPSVGESPRVDIVDSGVGRARLGVGVRAGWGCRFAGVLYGGQDFAHIRAQQRQLLLDFGKVLPQPADLLGIGPLDLE